jgi:hypothetical protein
MPRFEEYVVDHILGVTGRVQNAASDSSHRRSKAIVEKAQRFAISRRSGVKPAFLFACRFAIPRVHAQRVAPPLGRATTE